jgi:hypothetical protein
MSDPSRLNDSEGTPGGGSTDPGAPQPKGFTRIEGFSEATLRRFAGTTVVSVPRHPAKRGARGSLHWMQRFVNAECPRARFRWQHG